MKNLKVNEHFWASLDNKLVVYLKTGHGVYVCGDWKGEVDEKDLTFIEYINKPFLLEDKKIYFNHTYNI